VGHLGVGQYITVHAKWNNGVPFCEGTCVFYKRSSGCRVYWCESGTHPQQCGERCPIWGFPGKTSAEYPNTGMFDL